MGPSRVAVLTDLTVLTEGPERLGVLTGIDGFDRGPGASRGFDRTLTDLTWGPERVGLGFF